MPLDLHSLEKAVASLEEALITFDALPNTTEPATRLLTRDGIIHRFEYTVELCWKMLKRQLEESGLERVDALGIRDLFRVGFEQGLIEDPVPWFDYLKKRNLTSHTYEEETAQTVFETARLFLPDAKNLLLQLQKKNP